MTGKKSTSLHPSRLHWWPTARVDILRAKPRLPRQLAQCHFSSGNLVLLVLAAPLTELQQLKSLWFKALPHLGNLASRPRESVSQYSNIVRLGAGIHYTANLGLGKSLLYCIEKYGVTIIIGQTGCGKTTRETNLTFIKRKLTFFYKNYLNIFMKLATHHLPKSSRARNLEE